MEDIAPSLKLLLEVKRAIASGRAVRSGIESFLQFDQYSCFAIEFEKSLRQFETTQDIEICKNMTILQSALTETLFLGLKGESISSHLDLLEAELVISCECEINEALAVLPLKALLPLLGLIFPSMMMLLIEPILMLLKF
jgi:hypothetical protein